MKNTKIIATFGPAVADVQMVGKLVEGGVNLFRINCSHGTDEDFRAAAELIRQGAGEYRYPVAILMDMSGPKLRLDRFAGEIELEPGTELVLTRDMTDAVEGRVKVNHPSIINSVRKGDRMFVDDGQYLFEVVARTDDTVTVRSCSVGKLTGGKGINLPGVTLDIPTITEKDRRDISTAVELGADYVGLSFVRGPGDILEARELIQRAGGKQRIIAKLEKREAVDQLKEVMEAADGVMVARGDLGVELPPEDLPRLQREIIRMANRLHKPVIVATQMLESMRFSPRPTRAEVNDVASAVLDNVDAVMLSAETATGDYPAESVQMMARVIDSTEKGVTHGHSIPPERAFTEKIPQAIADAVSYTQSHETARVVFAYTTSGFTAQLLSNLFSPYPIIALTPDPRVMRVLTLYRSVYPVKVEQPESFTQIVSTVSEVGRKFNVVRPGDNVIITGGVPFGERVPTNFMLIAQVGKTE